MEIAARQTRIATINPATGEVVRGFEELSESELERKIGTSAVAFREYRRTGFGQRAEWLSRAAEILESRKREFAATMTLEMGKPILAAVQEVEKCAQGCRYYAENGAKFLTEEAGEVGSSRAFVKYQPLGPVLAVMPWNFPFWQVFRFAAPALMAGNTGLLKHASNVPQSALAIEEVFRCAGLPKGVFQTLLVGSGRVKRIIEDRRVAAVTLTGSVEAGRSVASAAGKAIKKTVLELGGSDPFIVMPSANLDQAVRTAVLARTVNNGQSCIAAKRFIIHQSIYSEFVTRFVRAMEQLKVGDPMDEATDIGPLATREVLESLADQVDRTVGVGARVLLGGKRLERPGYFYAPTVLVDLAQESPAVREELFGPVASLFKVESLVEAIEVANDCDFGLGSCIWTNDRAEQDQFVENIEAGLAFVNGMVASTPALPFGGVKDSGYGRELSHQGIREFVNVKTVVINEGGAPRPKTE